MPEDIQTRLKGSVDRCLKGYEAWIGDKKDAEVRAELVESIHELRRVTARLEIDVAIADRDLKGTSSIPVPSHKSNPKRAGGKKTSDRKKTAG